MAAAQYEERAYRSVIQPPGLVCYQVVEGESDLYVCTRDDRSAEAREALLSCRVDLERYLEHHLDFGTSFQPLPVTAGAPPIVRDMARAAEAFDVGPMAAVAGAVAQYVGTSLLAWSSEVIVENGGDLFLAGGGRRTVKVFAGSGLAVPDLVVHDTPLGVGLCTSSAKVGPSVSLGEGDAVTVLAKDGTIADAAATAIGNRVMAPADIGAALEMAERSGLVSGVVIAIGGALGVWGDLELA